MRRRRGRWLTTRVEIVRPPSLLLIRHDAVLTSWVGSGDGRGRQANKLAIGEDRSSAVGRREWGG